MSPHCRGQQARAGGSLPPQPPRGRQPCSSPHELQTKHWGAFLGQSNAGCSSRFGRELPAQPGHRLQAYAQGEDLGTDPTATCHHPEDEHMCMETHGNTSRSGCHQRAGSGCGQEDLSPYHRVPRPGAPQGPGCVWSSGSAPSAASPGFACAAHPRLTGDCGSTIIP